MGKSRPLSLSISANQIREFGSSQSLSSSETQGLLAGTKGYFRAKVYLKSWRTPENLFLPNQSQKWSNSVPLIGQKNIFLANQVQPVTLSPSYTMWFSSSIDLLGSYSRKILVESFRKKDSTKTRKSQAVTWGLGSNTLPSIFPADLSKVYRKFL